WLRGMYAASTSLSTTTGGDGRSGLPKPRSITSSPARRSSRLSSSTAAKTYGGRSGMRRNSIVRTVRQRDGGGPRRRRWVMRPLRIAALAALVAVAVALAGVGLPERARGQEADPQTRSISATGNGTVTAVPDRAQFSFGVQAQARIASAALEAA